MTPLADAYPEIVRQVLAAERGGLDIVGIQDHPYQRRFLRFELGIGAGSFWDAVAGMGGPHRTAGEAADALEEAPDHPERARRRTGEAGRARPGA